MMELWPVVTPMKYMVGMVDGGYWVVGLAGMGDNMDEWILQNTQWVCVYDSESVELVEYGEVMKQVKCSKKPRLK